jgi:hypothetical protein
MVTLHQSIASFIQMIHRFWAIDHGMARSRGFHLIRSIGITPTRRLQYTQMQSALLDAGAEGPLESFEQSTI